MPTAKFDVKVLLPPQKCSDEILCDIILSPRGPKEITAHNSFTSQNPATADTIDRARSIHNRTQRDNIDLYNQLVWCNPIKQRLKPQIIRQLAYSNTLLRS